MKVKLIDNQEFFSLRLFRLPDYDNTFPIPKYESSGASGFDIRACLPECRRKHGFLIQPYERALIPTSLKFSIPQGMELQVRPRSGLSLKTGLMVVNSPGTIDCDYTGEVKIIIGNLSQKLETIKHGDRIAQLVMCPVIQAHIEFIDNEDELGVTDRGDGGFGSTGVK